MARISVYTKYQNLISSILFKFKNKKLKNCFFLILGFSKTYVSRDISDHKPWNFLKFSLALQYFQILCSSGKVEDTEVLRNVFETLSALVRPQLPHCFEFFLRF